jgi:hypothetical protein
MRERRPITSVKRADQKIGYTEGDQAFDLFARPCASYDHATGLLRNLNNQMIVGYVSLKGSFVGSSSVAEELFPASSQNGGEPLDDTFSSSEHEPFDNGSSQGERELQVQSEPVNLTRPSLQDERASSDPPGLRDVPEPHQHSSRGGRGALGEPDVADERPSDGSSLQGEREQTGGSSLQDEPEPRAQGSSQGESASLATPLGEVALAALSGSREDDRGRSSRLLDPRDSSALGGWTRLWFIWLSICARPAGLKLLANCLITMKVSRAIRKTHLLKTSPHRSRYQNPAASMVRKAFRLNQPATTTSRRHPQIFMVLPPSCQVRRTVHRTQVVR